MTPEETKELERGLYFVTWKDGREDFAAIGYEQPRKEPWIALIKSDGSTRSRVLWRKIEKVEPIISEDVITSSADPGTP